MRPLDSLVLLAVAVASVRSGEYCDDFEDGDFGTFWKEGPYNTGGDWEPGSYKELKKTIVDFPEPANGDVVVYLTFHHEQTTSATLEMVSDYSFPEGSSISFRYWLRSEWEGSGTLEVHRVLSSPGGRDTILSLTSFSGPNNVQWKVASASIPYNSTKQKIEFFAQIGHNKIDNIAVDDIRVIGPHELNHKCEFISTTTSTTTETSTTIQPTTTSLPTTTTTIQPTTSAEASSTTTTGAPPTDVVPSPPQPIGPSPQFGPSVLLWLAFVTLGTSLVLLLLLALGRHRISSRRIDQIPLARSVSSCSDQAGSSWYDYIAGDPWRRLQDRLSVFFSKYR